MYRIGIASIAIMLFSFFQSAQAATNLLSSKTNLFGIQGGPDPEAPKLPVLPPMLPAPPEKQCDPGYGSAEPTGDAVCSYEARPAVKISVSSGICTSRDTIECEIDVSFPCVLAGVTVPSPSACDDAQRNYRQNYCPSFPGDRMHFAYGAEIGGRNAALCDGTGFGEAGDWQRTMNRACAKLPVGAWKWLEKIQKSKRYCKDVRRKGRTKCCERQGGGLPTDDEGSTL